MTTLHDFTVRTIDGADKSLADYRGRVALVVNVASRCGMTPQYAGLEELYREYREQGLDVLGFPCNQFGAQEPGTEAEIKTFCSTTYDVTFPLFAKVDVNGGAASPLYAWLTEQPTAPEGAGAVSWNFTKFLVGRDGKVVARFGPGAKPASETLVDAIEKALAT